MAPNTGRSDGRSFNNSREGRNMLLTTLKHAAKHAALGVGLALAISGAAQAEKVLRVGNDGEPQSMDPHYISTVQTSRLTDDMFLGLLTYGQDGKPIAGADRKSVVSGKSVSVRVDLGGRRSIKKKTTMTKYYYNVQIKTKKNKN